MVHDGRQVDEIIRQSKSEGFIRAEGSIRVALLIFEKRKKKNNEIDVRIVIRTEFVALVLLMVWPKIYVWKIKKLFHMKLGRELEKIWI